MVHRLSVFSIVTFLATFVNTSQAFASDHAHTDEAGAPQHIFAAKVLAGETIADEHTAAIGGAAVVFERQIVPEWLTLEACVALLFSEDSELVPLELVLKKPFELNESVEVYVGVGPVAIAHVHDGIHWLWGAIASVGSYFWFGEHLGLLLELDYNVISEDRHAVNEIEGGLGLAARF